MLRKSPKRQGPRAKTWLVSVTIYCTISNRNNSPPPRQFLRDKIPLKNELAREMLIEQITDFELMGPGFSGRTCTPKSLTKLNPKKQDFKHALDLNSN